jgi:transposase
MSRIRRTFGKDFKAKVVLEALEEKDTIEVLAKKHEVLPNQIPTEKLYARIGQLTLKNDFLKKSLG